MKQITKTMVTFFTERHAQRRSDTRPAGHNQPSTSNKEKHIIMYAITRRIGLFIIRLTLLALVALTALAQVSPMAAAPTTAPAMILKNLNLFVDPVNGNDANQGWSPDKPLKTLAKALAKVKPGCTIHLAAGSYTKNVNGEQYPLVVPKGVTIVGTLQSNGAKGSFLSASSSAAGQTGLIFAGDATVKDLELDVFG